ncbi:MAG: hypothetical protein H0U53_08455, partial [Actinobacteria bacterium]|nr:hypothetical protein [Actinomycetota bacterium]
MPESHRETIDIREYVATLKAHKWSVILTLLLVVGSALAFSFSQTPIYSATARLLVVPGTSNGTTTNAPALYITT